MRGLSDLKYALIDYHDNVVRSWNNDSCWGVAKTAVLRPFGRTVIPFWQWEDKNLFQKSVSTITLVGTAISGVYGIYSLAISSHKPAKNSGILTTKIMSAATTPATTAATIPSSSHSTHKSRLSTQSQSTIQQASSSTAALDTTLEDSTTNKPSTSNTAALTEICPVKPYCIDLSTTVKKFLKETIGSQSLTSHMQITLDNPLVKLKRGTQVMDSCQGEVGYCENFLFVASDYGSVGNAHINIQGPDGNVNCIIPLDSVLNCPGNSRFGIFSAPSENQNRQHVSQDDSTSGVALRV